jgi:hypothetical protein
MAESWQMPDEKSRTNDSKCRKAQAMIAIIDEGFELNDQNSLARGA